MSKKALLMILDGWGLGDQKKDDVIFNTPTPYWDYLMNTYPHSQLQASGSRSLEYRCRTCGLSGFSKNQPCLR